MKNYTFNFEVETLMQQFIGAFNDIKIKSYDKDKQISSEIPVRFVYAPKQRVYEKLNTAGPGGITVPAVSVSLGSITRDPKRVFNKNEGFLIPYHLQNPDLNFLKKIPQPVPVNIGVNFSIITKFQEHMDQILTNFIPYCDPYIIISSKFPGISESDIPFELRSEVEWSGSTSVVYPTELTSNLPFRITADTSFTIKSWLFKKFDEVVKKIYYINADFISSSDVYKDSKEEDQELLSTERISVSAKPTPLYTSLPHFSVSTLELSEVSVFGKWLLQPRAVYLSGSNPGMISNGSWFNPFSSISNLSALYEPFFATPISSFSFNNDNLLEFNLPEIPSSTGFLDIIIENEAGYGVLPQKILVYS